MAANLFGRYVWLIDILRRYKRLTFQEINELWQESSLGYGDELPLRTFHNHQKAIKDIFDVYIDCDRKDGYRYYIDEPERLEGNNLRSWLISSYATLNQIQADNKLEERIIFEDIPSGQTWLTSITEAMRRNHVLCITHQGFGKTEPSTFEIEPYCLKVVKRRWYVVARSPYYSQRNREKGIKPSDVYLVYALDHGGNDISNYLTFASTELYVPEGVSVTFEDSHVDFVEMGGGSVNGTAIFCSGTDDSIIADREYYFPSWSYIDATVEIVDSEVVSVTMVPCQHGLGFGAQYIIEPYNPYLSGMPYELNDDGSATVTDLGHGDRYVIVNQSMPSFEVTIGGVTSTYEFGQTIAVEPSSESEGMTFAGWFGGFHYYPAGTEYHVHADETLTDVWVPSYDFVQEGSVLKVDIGSDSVFYLADASSLTNARTGPTTHLTVRNDIGSVTVALADIPAGPVWFELERNDSVPDYMTWVDAPLYAMYASTLDEEGSQTYLDASITLNGEWDVDGYGSDGFGYPFDVTVSDGVTSFTTTGADMISSFTLTETGTEDGGIDTVLIVGIAIAVIAVIAIAAVVVVRRRNA